MACGVISFPPTDGKVYCYMWMVCGLTSFPPTDGTDGKIHHVLLIFGDILSSLTHFCANNFFQTVRG